MSVSFPPSPVSAFYDTLRPPYVVLWSLLRAVGVRAALIAETYAIKVWDEQQHDARVVVLCKPCTDPQLLVWLIF